MPQYIDLSAHGVVNVTDLLAKKKPVATEALPVEEHITKKEEDEK